MRVVLTAGFDRALHVRALGELLLRDGVDVAGILVVNPWQPKRVLALMRQHGRGFLGRAVRRMLGRGSPEGEVAVIRALLAEHGIAPGTLSAFAAERGIPHRTVSDLNAPAAIALLRELRPDGVVYGGGGILRRAFLDAAGGRVLNAHAGPLPEIRGMNACEWSLLLGRPPCITIHFIERGIDTGGVVARIPLRQEDGDTIERLRGRCAVLGVEGLRANVGALAAPPPAPTPGAAAHRQCFVLAPALREVLADRLAGGWGPAAPVRSRSARLLSSIRHTRPVQLLARLRLELVRRLRVRRLRGRVPALASPQALPALAAVPPLPLFAPRAELVERTQPLVLRFLARSREIALPVRWTPDAAERWPQLDLMNLHYMEYLEAVDDALFSTLVCDWIEANPPYEPGYWRDRWNSYTVSLRTVVWMQQAAARGARLRPATRDLMHRSLATQLRFLARHLEVDVRGNHLMKNVKALLWASRFFEGPEAESWRATGERLLARELGEQVLADGVHFERSPAYHAQVFADLLECFSVLRPGALRSRLEEALGRMAQATCDLAHPDGGPSLFNDGGIHMAYAPRECLDVHERLGGRRPAPRPVFALADAGYFGVRDGGALVIADCGATAPDFLPAHAHGDVLAFEWSLAGERFVVDAGVFEYAAGPARDYVRSTRAHNTVTIDGHDQCEFYGQFRMGRRARVRRERFEPRDGGFVLEGSHDGFAQLRGAPRHRRRIDATPRRIAVEDVVEGGAGQAVEARLLLHPEVRVEATEDGALLSRGGLTVRLRAESPVRIGKAWRCPDFGVRQLAPQLTLLHGPAPCRRAFALEVVVGDDGITAAAAR